MKKTAKGFTLIEMVIGIVLMAVLLQGVWSFFGETYEAYIYFQEKVALNNEADVIRSFVEKYIRESEEVTITTDGAYVCQAVEAGGATADVPVSSLKEIALDSSGTDSKEIKLSKITAPNSDIGEGEYKLKYTSGGTAMLVSDRIESMTVAQKKGSDIVTFTCVIHEAGESDERKKTTIVFSESLKHKQ